jgi:hypothetical protein
MTKSSDIASKIFLDSVQDVFPFTGDLFSVFIEPMIYDTELLGDLPDSADPLSISMVVKIVWFERPDDSEQLNVKNVKDVIEQNIHVKIAPHWTAENLREYWTGWQMIAGEILSRPTQDLILPSELFSARVFEVLDLKRPQIADDYAESLAVRSRLGRWLLPVAR